MSSEIIFDVEEAPEGGYTAVALGFPLVTEGDSMDHLKEMVREVVQLYFQGKDCPAVIRLHMVKDELISA
jgi:hypothetical protein